MGLGVNGGFWTFFGRHSRFVVERVVYNCYALFPVVKSQIVTVWIHWLVFLEKLFPVLFKQAVGEVDVSRYFPVIWRSVAENRLSWWFLLCVLDYRT